MPDFLEGEILLVDKPLTWTSFDVVNKIRYGLKRKLQVKKIKVGHAGTLDPLASGLLILCTGKQTKNIDGIQSQSKEYTGLFRLGATTASYDRETPEENRSSCEQIDAKKLENARMKFLGLQEQMPPIYSALKVDGQKAYLAARKGREIALKPREVEIHEFEIGERKEQLLPFRVRCSKGTYIRSLAHDFGQELGVGAYLSDLRRTAIGDYHVDSARGIAETLSFIEEQE